MENQPKLQLEYLKSLYKIYKKDKKFLEIYLDKLASYNRIQAKNEILTLKLPLEIISKISLKHNMNEITFLVFKKMGVTEKSISLLLNEISKNVKNVNFEKLKKNLYRLEDSLNLIELEEPLFDVSL